MKGETETETESMASDSLGPGAVEVAGRQHQDDPPAVLHGVHDVVGDHCKKKSMSCLSVSVKSKRGVRYCTHQ